MKLSRLYAYEILPQKNIDPRMKPSGGKLKIDNDVRSALTQLLTDTRLENESPIVFHVEDPNTPTRHHVVRQSLMAFLWGSQNTATAKANELALRLASVTDHRSTPFLLFVSGFTSNADARVVLWAFPKDQVFKFSNVANGPQVEVITDVFSVSSKIRKAALFDGTNDDNSFWEGRMLDLQSGTTDLWVEHFLGCRLSLTGSYGTLKLADYISGAYRKCDDKDAREQLFNAAIAVRTAPVHRLSYLKFAHDCLSEIAKDTFLAMVPPEERSLSFDFDRSKFESKIGFRVFKMKDEVYLSSPFGAIGNTVRITNSRFQYEGEIEQDVIRSRRVGG